MRQYSQAARAAQRQHGFSLLETAVVIAVLGILAAGILQLTTVFAENNAYDTTEQRIEEIHKAMTLYAAREGFLPCPADATPNDGQAGVAQSEDTNNEICTDGRDMVGVPWRTLGIQKSKTFDGWGNRFTYVVYDGSDGVTRGAENGERQGLNMLTCNCPGPSCDPENVYKNPLVSESNWTVGAGSGWQYDAGNDAYEHTEDNDGTLTLSLEDLPTEPYLKIHVRQVGASFPPDNSDENYGEYKIRGRIIEEINGAEVISAEDIVSYDDRQEDTDNDEKLEYIDQDYKKDKIVTMTYNPKVSNPELRLFAHTKYDGQVTRYKDDEGQEEQEDDELKNAAVLFEILNGDDPRKNLRDCVKSLDDLGINRDNWENFADEQDIEADTFDVFRKKFRRQTGSIADNYNEFLRDKGLTVSTDADDPNSVFMDPERGTGAAFAIISHGPNGAGAFGPASRTPDPTSENEKVNVTFDGQYVDAQGSEVEGEVFDDIVRAYTITGIAKDAGLYLRE